MFDSCIVFFFKQKTAYEMRISDWSSDVCSSDLALRAAAGGDRRHHAGQCAAAGRGRGRHGGGDQRRFRCTGSGCGGAGVLRVLRWRCRSEEHTSELQSLMRISYAVFCLKKKKNPYEHNSTSAQYQIEGSSDRMCFNTKRSTTTLRTTCN